MKSQNLPNTSTAKAQGSPTAPLIYYCHGHYWKRSSDGRWYKRGRNDIKLLLKSQGHLSQITNKPISPVDQQILRIQEDCSVQYAGPLAGYKDGIHWAGSDRILVTSSPKIITPVDGAWPTLEKLFDQLLIDPNGRTRNEMQLISFLNWLHLSYKYHFESISTGQLINMPSQVLAFAGPAGCGKSLTQRIITELLGGRCAKPYQFMTGDTAFNGDLFKAEHLTIEDESPSTDMRARRILGNWIKQIATGEEHRLHCKGVDAVMLNPFWRLTISLNEEPENLKVLPPLDESTKDKISIFRAYSPLEPFPTGTQDARQNYWQQLMAELPAFAYFLYHDWEIPDWSKDTRYGVVHYHNPELLDLIEKQKPETRLLKSVDKLMFSLGVSSWSGTSSDLKAALVKRSMGAGVPSTKGIGRLLGNLSRQQPHRVILMGYKGGQANWQII